MVQEGLPRPPPGSRVDKVSVGTDTSSGTTKSYSVSPVTDVLRGGAGGVCVCLGNFNSSSQTGTPLLVHRKLHRFPYKITILMEGEGRSLPRLGSGPHLGPKYLELRIS